MNRVRKLIGMEDGRTLLPTGKGITICILDSGIAPHTDFDNRIIAFHDFVEQRQGLYDDYGHGTHISGICAGSGKKSHHIYQGIAPESNLVIGKILNQRGDGRIHHLVEGIQWCMKMRQALSIRLLNISIGLMKNMDQTQLGTLLHYIDEAWNSGIVTVCAAGNNGPGSGTVTVPGTQPKVITVGSVEQGRNGISFSRYSGRGPTMECVLKPEIYAPGTDITSCSSTGGYTRKTGTSMAVPVVTGAIALLLEKEPWLTPVEVKLRLYESALALPDAGKHHTWGMLYVPDFLSIPRS